MHMHIAHRVGFMVPASRGLGRPTLSCTPAVRCKSSELQCSQDRALHFSALRGKNSVKFVSQILSLWMEVWASGMHGHSRDKISSLGKRSTCRLDAD